MPVYEALGRIRGASVQLAEVMEDRQMLRVISLSDIVKRVLPTGNNATSAHAVALMIQRLRVTWDRFMERSSPCLGTLSCSDPGAENQQTGHTKRRMLR